jgi:integrase
MVSREAERDRLSYEMEQAHLRRSMTVREWGEEWIGERATYSVNAADDARRWSKHVLSSPIASMSLAEVSEPIAREWLHGILSARKRNGAALAARTCQNALNMLRTAFADACEAGHVERNPFVGLKIPRGRRASTDTDWTFLNPTEQSAFLREVPAPDRWLVEFAIGTGMRQGEQWAMKRRHVAELGDSVLPMPSAILDRRVVPLFGMAATATLLQCDFLDGKIRFPSLPRWEHDPHALLWPSPKGGPREKKAPKAWRSWLDAAGIVRNVRWRDLRHTCAVSLLSGWWGRTWSLEEVKELLGHSSITITERYARTARDVLGRAARSTPHWSQS